MIEFSPELTTALIELARRDESLRDEIVALVEANSGTPLNMAIQVLREEVGSKITKPFIWEIAVRVFEESPDEFEMLGQYLKEHGFLNVTVFDTHKLDHRRSKDDYLDMLVRLPFPKLKKLNLAGKGKADTEKFAAFCRQPQFKNLTFFSMKGASDSHCISLANSPMSKLKTLVLNMGDLTDRGVQALVKSNNFSKLEELFIPGTKITDKSLDLLVLADGSGPKPSMPKLKKINLDSDGVVMKFPYIRF